MRAADEPPVCQTLMDRASRFAHIEHRQRAAAGNGQKGTSRWPLCPQRVHSMKTVTDPLSIARGYVETAHPQQAALRRTV